MPLSKLDQCLIDAETAEQTELLLKAGADPNATSFFGFTASMRAKTAEQTELLPKAGADPNAKDSDGRTALMRAHNES